MPLQLWETTMNPESRLLKQLKVEDAAEANIVFSSLMGARVCALFLFDVYFYLNLVVSICLSTNTLIIKKFLGTIFDK